MTRAELVAEIAKRIGAQHEARFIVEEVLGTSAGALDAPVTPDQREQAQAMARRRAGGEPLQYILGHWAFRSLDLVVDPRVLIPRPETEQVVEVALGELGQLGDTARVVVDAGTGSGAIALSLASELATTWPDLSIWATDVSFRALAVTSENLERLRDRNGEPLLSVTIAEGSWFAALPPELKGSVDLVISNPPYVALSEWDDLPAEVRQEPAGALVSGAATDGTPGLGDAETLLRQCWTWLARPGSVVIELAPHQMAAAVRLAESIGYVNVEVMPDLSGNPRALVARVN